MLSGLRRDRGAGFIIPESWEAVVAVACIGSGMALATGLLI